MKRSRNILSLYALNAIVLIPYLLFGCEKFEPERIVKVETGSVTNVDYTSCSVQGTIIEKGENGILQHGFCWSVTQNPTTGKNKIQLGTKSSTGNFSGNLTGLSAGTTYYVRAYAQNKNGIFYGVQKSFTTLAPSTPTVTTTSISNITENSAESGGIFNYRGASVTALGVCWSTSQIPNISDNHTTDNIDGGYDNGIFYFSSSITGLSPGTTYYVRAYATNSVGTAYGNEIEFMTIWDNSTISDFDGNVYQTVQIGNQIWMKENLKTTKYNDGTAIPLVTNSTEWGNLTTPGYCWYNNDEAGYKNTYGALYNWHTVNIGKLCPTGWHVPTDSEWTTLTDYLGGESVAGGKLKEAGTMHWDNPNTGATNESGFTALPGGLRGTNGAFYNIGYSGHWWSSTEDSSINGWTRFIYYNYSNVLRNDSGKEYGFSVRCVRDY